MKRFALSVVVAAAVGCSGGGGSSKDPADKEIRIAPVAGPVTEAGSETSFTVVLNAKPGKTVTIALASSDASEGAVNPASLTFTKDDWDAPQTVFVTGIDDAIADGNVSFDVELTVTAGDSAYLAAVVDPVAVWNLDDETAGIRVGPVAGVTSEFGDSVVVPVVLQSEPTADVVLIFGSSNLTEAATDVQTLTFTPVNWNAPQNITVTGIDDDLPDGLVNYSIIFQNAASDDAAYSGLAIAAVALGNVDNDSPGIIVSPLTAATRESDGVTPSVAISVRLSTPPSAFVSLDFKSSDTGECDIQDDDGNGTTSTLTLVFNTVNWMDPQTVFLIGDDDFIADGDQPYQLQVTDIDTTDAGYDTLIAPDVNLVNLDDDSPGISVSPLSGIADETGGYMSFTMELDTQPSADVTIPMAVSEGSEARLSHSSYTFTTGSWDEPITIYVAGVEDGIADGNQPWFVQFSPAVSSDANYDGRKPADLVGHTIDDGALRRVVIFDDGIGNAAADAVTGLGWTPEVVTTATDLEIALTGSPDLVIVESSATMFPLSTEQSLATWTTAGGALILSHWDLDSTTTLTSSLDVSVSPYVGHRFVFPESVGLVDLFDVKEEFPFPLTGQAMFVENGHELVPGAGDVGARLDSLSGPGGIAVTNGGRTVVNGFTPDEMFGTDNDGDAIPDMRELYDNEIAYVLGGGSPETFSVTEPVGLTDDESSTFAASTLRVTAVPSVPTKITASVHIAHTNAGDVDVFLVGPDGTTLELVTDRGDSDNDGFGSGCHASDSKLTFDDDSPAFGTSPASGPWEGSFKPEGTAGLAAFEGIDPNGTWTLQVADDDFQDFGVIKCWSLTFTF